MPPSHFTRYTWLPLSTVAPMVCAHVETVRRWCKARRLIAYRPASTGAWLVAVDDLGRVVNNAVAP